MYRTVPYIVLFLILALLQIFLFDNLSISIYLCPLVYIGFIVLLPIDAPPVAVLFLALSMSVAMDWVPFLLPVHFPARKSAAMRSLILPP